MASPAQRHRMRVLGRAAAAATADHVARAAGPRGETASEYELVRAKLGIDLRRLRQIQAQERKIEAKRLMLPEYEPWIDGVLAAEAEGKGGAPDEILVHVMIWRIDVGDYAGALPLIAYVLKHKLPLPDRFKRTAATLIAELSADAALRAIGQGYPFDIGYLLEVDALTAGEDMIDQVRAKIEKAIGLLLASTAASADADGNGPAGGKRAALARGIRHLKRALALDPGAGVKGDLKRLERDEKKLAEPPPAATA